MTKSKAVVMVAILAVLVAGVAAWSIYNYLQTETAKVKASQPRDIVVATTDIPIGTKINEKMVKIAPFPRESLPPGGGITDPGAVIGRVVIRPIGAGDAITDQKLVPKEGAAGAGIMTYLVPEGHRAVTVAVNEVAGVAGFLTPADRVDVVVTTQPPGSTERLSKIVLQNVPVLAIGQITQMQEGKPVVVPTVTLDLTPDDSEKLVIASSQGQLQMLLRNISDTVTVESHGATIQKVLGEVERPARKSAHHTVRHRTVRRTAAPSPPPMYSVEIIKGKERSTKQFAQ